MRAEGEAWVDAEEAYLGIAVTDRDDGQDWLSETCGFPISRSPTATPRRSGASSPRSKRSIAKVNAWLAEQEKGGPAEAEPPSHPTET